MKLRALIRRGGQRVHWAANLCMSDMRDILAGITVPVPWVVCYTDWKKIWSLSGPCTTKGVQHVLDLFTLPGFTKPNKSNPANQSHEAGYQLVNQLMFSSFTHEHVHMKEVCSIWPITDMDWAVSGSRAACFKYGEQTDYSEEKQLQPSDARRSEKKIIDCVNA